MSILSFAKKITGAKDRKKNDNKKKSARSLQSTKQTKDVKTAVKTKGKVKKTRAKSGSLSAGRIKLAPMLTEKSVILQSKANTYAFRVVTKASKGQIARAIQDQYGIKPVKVRTITMSPKARRRGRTTGFTSGWKKAYVTFPAGQGIDHGV